MRYFFLGLVLITSFWGCKESREETDIYDRCLPEIKPETDLKLKVESLDQLILNLPDKKAIRDFLDKHPEIAEKYFSRSRYPSDTILIAMLADMASKPSLDSLSQDCKQKIGLAKIESELSEAFSRIKTVFPDFRIPEVKTMVTGFGSYPITQTPDIHFSEDGKLLVIGWDYFLGPDYKYKLDQPEYIARRYKPATLTPLVVLAISAYYNKTNPKDASLLADMIFYGKSYYFVQRILNCLPDSLIMGYTSKQIKIAESNKDLIWKHYIDKNVLYQTSQQLKAEYIEDAPFTLPISQEAPGSIGRWTGLRIIKKYMHKNDEVGLKKLMANDNAQQIFEESGYRGE